MARFPLPPNPNEVFLRLDDHVLRTTPRLPRLGYTTETGRLWLTDQRLVFEREWLGAPVAFPLRHITRAAQADLKIVVRRARHYYVDYPALLSIAFDNGGQEYFVTQDISGWAAAITAAIPTAPDLPFARVPSPQPAVEQGDYGQRALPFLIALALVVSCCSGLFGFGVLALLFRYIQ